MYIHLQKPLIFPRGKRFAVIQLVHLLNMQIDTENAFPQPLPSVVIVTPKSFFEKLEFPLLKAVISAEDMNVTWLIGRLLLDLKIFLDIKVEFLLFQISVAKN